jgi:transposase-like protein
MEKSDQPVPGIGYPRTFQEMDERFRSEASYREYIQRLRWPKGFVCPKCGVVGEPWMMSRGRLRCRTCEWETSLTAGTVFQDTRKPLRMWFLAMWFITSQKNGVSALGLQRVLGLGSYETAWTRLHKLRRAMVRPGRDLLSGVVEVDDTYVGGPEEGTRGRKTEYKAIVAVAVEKNGRDSGRIRLRRIGDVSADSLLPFVQSAVMPGSTVHTGGWKGYAGLEAAGYRHQATVIGAGSNRLTRSCRGGATLSRRFSSGGCSACTREASSTRISTTTSRFALQLLSVYNSRIAAASGGSKFSASNLGELTLV